MFSAITSFFPSLWVGFESPQERRKFMLLSVIFGLILGVYWLLRPLKDGVFLTMVGPQYLGRVKLLSVVVIVPIVFIVTKLVDMFPRHRILYGISALYAVLSVVFAILIMHPETGIANTVESTDRILGWAFYLFVETIGSVLVSFFWSFVSDITAPESAKRGYSLVILGAQFGSVFFPFVGGNIVQNFGSGTAVACGAVSFLFIPAMVYYFMTTVSKDQMQGFNGDEAAIEGKPPKPTFYEGLQLILTRPYLLGIFAVVTLYEIVATILEFQMKGLAKASVGGGDALTMFMMKYAVWVNLTALLCAALGAGKISKKLGLAKTLLCMPIIVGLAALGIAYIPVLNVVFWLVVLLKGVNYSLNQPAKEQLYIPTSKDSKYKAKSWIDMFGSRSSKSLGGVIHDLFKSMGPDVFVLGTLTVSFGLIGVWAYAAIFLGKTHAEAIKENRIVC